MKKYFRKMQKFFCVFFVGMVAMTGLLNEELIIANAKAPQSTIYVDGDKTVDANGATVQSHYQLHLKSYSEKNNTAVYTIGCWWEFSKQTILYSDNLYVNGSYVGTFSGNNGVVNGVVERGQWIDATFRGGANTVETRNVNGVGGEFYKKIYVDEIGNPPKVHATNGTWYAGEVSSGVRTWQSIYTDGATGSVEGNKVQTATGFMYSDPDECPTPVNTYHSNIIAKNSTITKILDASGKNIYANNHTLPSAMNNVGKFTVYSKTTDSSGKTAEASRIVNVVNPNFNLTVNPNGGTWNGSSNSQKFSLAYNSSKTIAKPTRTGYIFTGWSQSGNPNGSLYTNGYTNSHGEGNGSLSVTRYADYTNYRWSNLNSTVSAWDNIVFSNYSVSAGQTVKITGKIKINSIPSGMHINLYHGAKHNDYQNCKQNIYTTNGNWMDFEISRTFTESSSTARFEVFSSDLKGITGNVSFDLKDIEIKNVSTNTVVPDVITMPANDVTLTANWQKSTYDNWISHWMSGFKNNEGTNSSKNMWLIGNTTFKADVGNSYVMDSSKAKRIPKGFELKKTFGTSSVSGTWSDYPMGTSVVQKPNEMNYEYDYLPITYKINYNLDGGVNNPSNPSSYNVLYGVTLNNPSRSGYTFKGWYNGNAKVDGINKGANASFTSESDMYAKLDSRTIGDVTVTAKWEPINYSITYDLKGGTVSGNPTSYNIETPTFTLKNPIKTGHIFTGWTGSNGLNKQTTVTINKGSTGNKSYVANWVVNQYAVRYHGNGATGGSMTESIHTYNVSKPLNTNQYVRTGYTFKNWNTKADGTGTSYADKQSVINLTSANNGIVNLYAQWVANTYTIKYDGNGATGGNVAPSTHTYDVAKALTPNNYVKTNNKFMGWNAKKDGTGRSFKDKEVVKNLTSINKGVVTLYAQWDEKPTINAEDKEIYEGQYTEEEWKEKRIEDVTAIDKEDGDITKKIEVIEDTVDLNVPGEYEVTYRVEDNVHNITEKTIKVVVLYNNPPKIEGEDRWFFEDEEITDTMLLERVKATDVEDGNITDKAKIKNHNVQSGVIGDYDITYTITDDFGKTTETSNKIHIVRRMTDTTSSNLRGISGKYLNTLKLNSLWRTGERNAIITGSLNKTQDSQAIQHWRLTADDIKRIKQFNKEHNWSKESNQEFLNEFSDLLQ